MSMNKLIAKEAQKLRDKEKRKKELNTPITKQQYDTIVSNQFIDGKHVSELPMDTVYTYAYNTNPNLNTYTKLRAYHIIAINYILASTNTKEYQDQYEDDYDY